MAWDRWLTTIAKTLNIALERQSLQERLLKDPYYRLRSAQEIELAAKLGIRIDANRATVDDWLRLPGLSIHQARTLTQLTTAGVQFYSLEDVAAALGRSPQALLVWKPVLTFCYYETDEPLTMPPINVNTASVEQLVQIPVVDLFLARTIVENRQAHGNYQTLAHLQQRLMLSPGLVSDLLHYLRF
ncbi:MAG: ComEA family DNA-binding protein [Cyanobacteriota bacterium SKYGB_h_bin112]|nr:ComEA family DNA-binding protein [Cyanobacteriota bacterium SKYGB_h_bin112]